LREKAARRGAHRKGVDSGDARTESGMEEGLRQWKTWRGGWLGGGEACAELRHGRARQTERGVKKIRPTASGSVLRAAWDSGEGGSGSGDAMRHEACGAWLRPAGSVPTVS
jgi:hypothetical protein